MSEPRFGTTAPRFLLEANAPSATANVGKARLWIQHGGYQDKRSDGTTGSRYWIDRRRLVASELAVTGREAGLSMEAARDALLRDNTECGIPGDNS